MPRRIAIAAIAVLAATAAEAAVPDRTATEAAALFVVACLPATGQPAKLRNWAGHHQLPALPPDAAANFLGGQPGQVYIASRLGAPMALVSFNSGECAVSIEAVDFNSAVSHLSSDMQRAGFDLAPVGAKADPGHQTEVAFRAQTAKHGWLITATMHPHEDAPGMLPEVDLLAKRG